MKLLPFWLILAILLVFPLGQLTRITLFAPEIHLYWQDILIIVLLSYCLIVLFLKKRESSNSSLMGPIVSFFAIGLFSLLLNSHKFSLSQIFISSLYLFRWLSYTTVYFTVLQFSKKQKGRILELMIIAGVVSAFFGLIQYFFFPDARGLVSEDWDPHLFRIIGTFLDPGFTGLVYVFTLILLVDSAWGEKRKAKRLITYYLLLITYLALVLTYARSAYLAFIVGMLMVAYFKKSAKFGLAMVLLLFVTLPFLPRLAGEGVKLERQNSVWSRLDSWKKAMAIFKDSPVFGIGFNTYRYVQAEKGFLGNNWQESHAGAGADSSLLLILATTGIVGLLMFLSLYFKIFKIGLANEDYRFLSSLAAVFAHSLFNNSLFYPWVMIWMWVLLGLSRKKP